MLGVSGGICAALAITRLLSKWLFGVDPIDTITFVLVPLAVLTVACLGCMLPATSASPACCTSPDTPRGSATSPSMMSMLTSKRSSKPAASYGNPPPTFPACFASRSCPILRALPLWSLLPTRRCLRRNAPHRPPPAPSAGTNSTQRTSKADLTSTTSSLVGPRSAIWTWGQWAFIASSMRATTSRWATAA